MNGEISVGDKRSMPATLNARTLKRNQRVLGGIKIVWTAKIIVAHLDNCIDTGGLDGKLHGRFFRVCGVGDDVSP